ncbi:MAG: hypothetical protein HN341_14040 [Verrucomicrobia bacterium]|jgi:hypothetical protein|nr:hypothetical protein [Verrucomicrobiota bacterium]
MKQRYRSMLTCIPVLVCLLVLSARSMGQPAETRALSRRQFQEIASKLDLGGDLLLVANTDAIIDQFIEAAMASETSDPVSDPHEKEVHETLDRFQGFLNRNGFAALHGIGLSLVPREDGLNAAKIFISRDFVDSNLPLWRGVVGWHPRHLLSLDFIPGDAVMARAGTPELASLWKVLSSAVDEVAPPPSQERFAAWHKKTNEMLGVELEAMIKSLRDEVLVAVRLSETEQAVMPTRSGLVPIPAPSFLIVVGANDDMLRGVVEAQFAKHRITLTETQVGDVIMRSTTHKLPSLFPLQPAFASQAGFFLIGSSPDMVADALLAYRHKNGLLARPEFRNAFQGLSMVNNGIVYVSPRMGKVVGDVNEANLKSTLSVAGKHPATARMLKQLLTHGGQDQSCAFTIQNWKSGVMVMGSSAWGGKDMIARMAATPIQLVTALLDGSHKSSSNCLLSLLHGLAKKTATDDDTLSETATGGSVTEPENSADDQP